MFSPEESHALVEVLEREYRKIKLEYHEMELKLQAGQVEPNQYALNDLESSLDTIARQIVVIERAAAKHAAAKAAAATRREACATGSATLKKAPCASATATASSTKGQALNGAAASPRSLAPLWTSCLSWMPFQHEHIGRGRAYLLNDTDPLLGATVHQ